MVVLDTCAIIELCKDVPTLKENTVHQISTGAYILSISFAEIACKIKAQKLNIDIEVKTLYENIIAISNIVIVNIEVEHWLNSIELDWTEQKDPADRLIVAFAKQHALSIVTSDQKIKNYYKKVMW